MRLKIGDKVLVTGGKDKGKKSVIIAVLPEANRVVVEGVNMYTKNVKPQGDRSGEQVRRERSLPLANVAILNDKDVQDRIGYKITKDGKKERVFKKTGKVIPDNSKAKKTK